MQAQCRLSDAIQAAMQAIHAVQAGPVPGLMARCAFVYTLRFERGAGGMQAIHAVQAACALGLMAQCAHMLTLSGVQARCRLSDAIQAEMQALADTMGTAPRSQCFPVPDICSYGLEVR